MIFISKIPYRNKVYAITAARSPCSEIQNMGKKHQRVVPIQRETEATLSFFSDLGKEVAKAHSNVVTTCHNFLSPPLMPHLLWAHDVGFALLETSLL